MKSHDYARELNYLLSMKAELFEEYDAFVHDIRWRAGHAKSDEAPPQPLLTEQEEEEALKGLFFEPRYHELVLKRQELKRQVQTALREERKKAGFDHPVVAASKAGSPIHVRAMWDENVDLGYSGNWTQESRQKARKLRDYADRQITKRQTEDEYFAEEKRQQKEFMERVEHKIRQGNA